MSAEPKTTFDDAKTKTCPKCGTIAERRELFTSFYYQCQYIWCADYQKEPETISVEDSVRVSGGAVAVGQHASYNPAIRRFANSAPYGGASVPLIPSLRITHMYSLKPHVPEVHFQKAGDVVSINGNPAYTVPLDGYYKMHSDGGMLRM